MSRKEDVNIILSEYRIKLINNKESSNDVRILWQSCYLSIDIIVVFGTV